MISSYLRNRALGFPHAQKNLQEAMDQRLRERILQDRSSHATIELAPGASHQFCRNKDYLAVLSESSSDAKVRTVALWHLPSVKKVWDIQVFMDCAEDELHRCLVSRTGLVVLQTHLPNQSRLNTTVVWEGVEYQGMPRRNWTSVMPVGNRILTAWRNSLKSWKEDTHHFFGEWSFRGDCIYEIELDHNDQRDPNVAVGSENYWIGLSGNHAISCSPLIECVNRAKGILHTFELPLQKHPMKFSSACIVNDRLIYGIQVAEEPTETYSIPFNSSLNIFDLSHGTILRTFPCEINELYFNPENQTIAALTMISTPRRLIANTHYVAWTEYQGSGADQIKYMDLRNYTIVDSEIISFSEREEFIGFDISGSLITVLDHLHGRNRAYSWHRRTIVMDQGNYEEGALYRRTVTGECSMSNGILLFTDVESNPPRMNIEHFGQDGISVGKAAFRV